MHDIEYSSGTPYSEFEHFENFKKSYPNYLEELKEKSKHIYNAYSLLCDRWFSKINKTPEIKEISEHLALGMLFRHAVEAVTSCLAAELGIDATDKTVDERLEALKGHSICGHNKISEGTLYKAKMFSNETAHAKIIKPYNISAEELKNFYIDEFQPVLASYITAIKNLGGSSLIKRFSVPSEIRNFRSGTVKYLTSIKRELDNFKLSNKITSILLKGCFIRQLLECTVNLWCYNQRLTPTDYSAGVVGGEDGMHKKLIDLAAIAEYNNPQFSAFNKSVIDNLFEIKKVTNCLMHIDAFTIKNIHNRGADIVRLYPIVHAECSPQAIMTKFANVKGIKLDRFNLRSILIVSLCGIAGWLGIHEFYAGNIGTGIRSVLRFLWGVLCIFSTVSGNVPPLLALIFAFWPIVAPLLSFNELDSGRFYTAKWGTIPSSKLITVISTIFTILHLYIDYLIIVKLIF